MWWRHGSGEARHSRHGTDTRAGVPVAPRPLSRAHAQDPARTSNASSSFIASTAASSSAARLPSLTTSTLYTVARASATCRGGGVGGWRATGMWRDSRRVRPARCAPPRLPGCPVPPFAPRPAVSARAPRRVGRHSRGPHASHGTVARQGAPGLTARLAKGLLRTCSARTRLFCDPRSSCSPQMVAMACGGSGGRMQRVGAGASCVAAVRSKPPSGASFRARLGIMG